MLPKIQKTLHNRRLMFSMATVTNESTFESPQPAEKWVTLPSNACNEPLCPVRWRTLCLSPQGRGSVLRHPLVVWRSNCMPRQIPPEGPVILKQRLWHNESFAKLTAWLRECILVYGSGRFLDVDVCLHPYPPRFLSFLDRFRKREQPRWEWWEFLVGVHTFHLLNREKVLLGQIKWIIYALTFFLRMEHSEKELHLETCFIPGPSLAMAHKRS